MDKLETLIACLPNAPYKTLFAVEINALRAEIVTLQSDNTRLTLELDEAGSNCSMYKQQVLMLTKERDELKISNAFAHGEWRAVKDQLAALTAERDAEFEYRKKVERERLHHSSEREALARQLAAMTDERDELSRLHKSAVLECQRSFVREEICAKEMARRDARTNKPRTSPQVGWDELRRQLAAAQAREAKLRGAIADDSFAITFQSIGQYRSALLKLALPADDTALQARLKEERERCKKECEGFTHRDDKEVAEAIAVAIGSMT